MALPTADFEIQQGGRLIVRETQAALFVDQGHVADFFEPGTYTIRGENLLVLTDLRHWSKGFESPFKSEVYFFSMRLRVNQTWGTANPLSIRDAEFGAKCALRGYGVYSYRIGIPASSSSGCQARGTRMRWRTWKGSFAARSCRR
jgi:membrane protease subunit (stomatin/prohibitin family)